MSYYILPKKNTSLDLKLSLSNEPVDPIISHSLIHYITTLTKQLQKYLDDNIDLIKKLSNTYEFIFSKVPSSKFSVSKLKPNSNSFYIFLEIINVFDLLSSFEGNNIKTIHFSPNADSTIECMDMLREDRIDINFQSILKLDEFYPLLGVDKHSIEFLFFELKDDNYENKNQYAIGLLIILCNILSYQSTSGVTIIKFNDIYHKPVLDVLYILTTLYDKVFIIKPNVSNSGNNDRYVVCKNFIINSSRYLDYMNYFTKCVSFIKEFNAKPYLQISSLLADNLPYYFLNKVEESNIIIGHQQLDFIDLVISIIKNKNKDDKIESIKKSNIQKCIHWCEKHKIPYNKFVDKVNIFLPSINYDKEFIDDIVTPEIQLMEANDVSI
jgi:hypothetical protein